MPRFLHPPLATPVAFALAAVALVFATSAWSSPATSPRAHASATCADYPDQAAAQRAADTRDPDGDGRYCEDLPCPCAGPGAPSRRRRLPTPPPPSGAARSPPASRTSRSPRPSTPTSAATSWPPCAAAGRARWCSTGPAPTPAATRLLEGFPTRDGFDRDEYPPAVGRGQGKGLERGRHPRGWKADVRYVPSSENRSHGSVLGIKLRRFCDGTRFRYVFY